MTVDHNFNYLYGIYLYIVINGNWGPWYDTTKCSKTCGNGVKTRQRKCNNPAPNGGTPCHGPSVQTIKCNLGICLGINCHAP